MKGTYVCMYISSRSVHCLVNYRVAYELRWDDPIFILHIGAGTGGSSSLKIVPAPLILHDIVHKIYTVF